MAEARSWSGLKEVIRKVQKLDQGGWRKESRKSECKEETGKCAEMKAVLGRGACDFDDEGNRLNLNFEEFFFREKEKKRSRIRRESDDERET